MIVEQALILLGLIAIMILYAVNKRRMEQISKKVYRAKSELQFIMDTTPAQICYLDLNHRIVRINEHFRAMFERPYKELLGCLYYELYPEELAGRYRAHNTEVIRTKEPKLHVIEEFITKKGHKRWIKADKVPYFDDEGNLKGIVLVSTDITDIKELQEELALANMHLQEQVEVELSRRMESQQKYEALFNSGNDGFLVGQFTMNEGAGFYTEANDVICKMLGFTKEELQKMTFMDIGGANAREIAEEYLKEIAINKKALFETELITKTGDRIIAEINAKLILHEHRTSVFYAVRDITRRKQLEAEEKQSEQLFMQQSKMAALGEMLSMIAHQWRQPLSAISVMAGSVKLDLEDGEMQRDVVIKDLEKIVAQTKYLSQTIEDFRAFFKPNREREAILLMDVIQSAINLLNDTFENRNITIKVSAQCTTEPLHVYKNELIQVIISILKNAIDVFVERKVDTPEIKLTCGVSDDYQFVRIEDNAGGIEDSVIEKVFEPYFTTKDEKNGTGIGLYMVKMIIERHSHGRVAVENTLQGAAFTLYLRNDSNQENEELK